MENTKLTLLSLFCCILLFCCKNKDEYGPLYFGKLELPYEKCRDDGRDLYSSCVEAYVVSNFDTTDAANIDTINNYVIEHYSKEKASKYTSYYILFYRYNFYGENGVNERMPYKEVVFIPPLISYEWTYGVFRGILRGYSADIIRDSVSGL